MKISIDGWDSNIGKSKYLSLDQHSSKWLGVTSRQNDNALYLSW